MHREPSLDSAEVDFFAEIQLLLSREQEPLPKRIRRICAVDAAYHRSNVVAVATEFTDGSMSEQSVYSGHFTFPYVSGLFYLHEGPSAVAAVRRLNEKPQLLCFDAHGAAHPRSAGLSTICGMILGTPSIGVAKSPLTGRVVRRDGAHGMMLLHGRVVGIVTGFKHETRYWSPGYSVSMRKLKAIIHEHGATCLDAMAESHRLAGQAIKSVAEAKTSIPR